MISGEKVVNNYKFTKFSEVNIVDEVNVSGNKIYKKFFEEN